MAHEIDTLIGQNIRAHRLLRGLTQMDLAAKIGVKFQQLQKYETGANRVSGSRLHMIAKALDAKPGDFFEGDDFPDWPIHMFSSRVLKIANLANKMPADRQAALLSAAEALSEVSHA